MNIDENSIEITVIIPLYNAQDYIKSTLDDATGQTINNIEIICVDDGSTDDSAQIVREYAKMDDRVHLLQQEHQYAGVARNTGLSHARGKYVAFWDADDSFDQALLEKLHQKITENQADISICNAYRLDMETGILIREPSYLVTKYLDGADVYSKDTHPQYLFNIATNVPWNKMYRREFIEENQLRYEATPRANDWYFTMMAVYRASKIAVVTDRLVTYRSNNPKSLTGTLSQSPLCALEVYERVKEKLEEAGAFENPLIAQSFHNRALQSSVFVLRNNTKGEAYEEVYRYLKEGCFARLGVEMRESYYYSQVAYESYQRIMQMTPLDYVLRQGKETKEKLQKRNGELNQRIQELNQQIKEQKQQIKQQKDEIWKLNNMNHPLKWVAKKVYHVVRRK